MMTRLFESGPYAVIPAHLDFSAGVIPAHLDFCAGSRDPKDSRGHAVNERPPNANAAAVPSPPLAIAAVLLFSDEPDALAGFYRDVLGVPLRPIRLPDAVAHWACEIRQVYFSIWPADEDATQGAASRRGGVAFYVKDVDQEFGRLKALGVEVVFAPRCSALGKIARLKDPDGNPFELYQPVLRR